MKNTGVSDGTKNVLKSSLMVVLWSKRPKKYLIKDLIKKYLVKEFYQESKKKKESCQESKKRYLIKEPYQESKKKSLIK